MPIILETKKIKLTKTASNLVTSELLEKEPNKREIFGKHNRVNLDNITRFYSTSTQNTTVKKGRLFNLY